MNAATPLHAAHHHSAESARLALAEAERLERLRHEASTSRHKLTYAAGRFTVAAVFVISAIIKGFTYAETREALSNFGVPDAGLMLTLAIAIELIGGGMLVAGYRAREVAAAMIAYLAVVTFVLHSDFSVALNRAFAAANLGLAGGLLMIAGHGAGGVSVDKKIAAHKG